MNKTEALANLAELKKQADELEKQIQSMPEDRAPSLLTKPVPGDDEDYWSIDKGDKGKLDSCAMAARSPNEDWYDHGNIFQTEALAQAYVEAIDTMLLLRHQPGTVPAGKGTKYLIRLDDLNVLSLDWWAAPVNQMPYISPMFESKKAAQAAIKAVGEARILRMFKTFHHIPD